MPPKRTGKRQKISHSAVDTDVELLQDAKNHPRIKPKQNALGALIQTSKALLPPELLLIIISHLSCMPSLLTDNDALQEIQNPDVLERSECLRALSQTCREWRDMFFDMAWEHLQACVSRKESSARYKVFGDALVRRGRLVVECPHVAERVRRLSISLSRYSMHTVLPSLVTTLSSLPNLSTFEITQAHHLMSGTLKNHFQSHVFPQIRTIICPPEAHNILRSCAKVRKVVCIHGFGGGLSMVGAIGQGCPEVEELSGLETASIVIRRIPKAIPNLRSLTFSGYSVDSSSLQPLQRLSSITHIGLLTHHTTFDELRQDAKFLLAFKAAKDVIRGTNNKPQVERVASRTRGSGSRGAARGGAGRTEKDESKNTIAIYSHYWSHENQLYENWTKIVGVDEPL